MIPIIGEPAPTNLLSKMTENFFKNLTPNSPTQFGRALASMAEATLPSNKRSNQASLYLAEQTDIDYSIIRSLIRGEISKSEATRGKALNPERFQKLVEYFWEKKGGLNTSEEVINWARTAGEEYVLELGKDWFIELVGKVSLSNPPSDLIKPSIYPSSPRLITRETIIEQVLEKVPGCLSYQSPLVLYGPPGIGKTTIIKSLEYNSRLIEKFKSGALMAYVGGGSAEPFLFAWLQTLGINSLLLAQTTEKLKVLLNKKIKDGQYLVLIDDVSDPVEVRTILPSDLSKSLAIITTRDFWVASSLAKTAEFIIHVPPMNESEVYILYENGWGQITSDVRRNLSELNKFLAGNPLSLQYALHLISKVGWQPALQLLRQETRYAQPKEISDHIFLPMHTLYQSFSCENRRRIRAFGLLPSLNGYCVEVFAGLWNVPTDTAYYLLSCFEPGFIKKRESAYGNNWDIHEQTFIFAKQCIMDETEKLTDITDELTAGSDWLVRSIRLIDAGDLNKTVLAILKNWTPLQYFTIFRNQIASTPKAIKSSIKKILIYLRLPLTLKERYISFLLRLFSSPKANQYSAKSYLLLHYPRFTQRFIKLHAVSMPFVFVCNIILFGTWLYRITKILIANPQILANHSLFEVLLAALQGKFFLLFLAISLLYTAIAFIEKCIFIATYQAVTENDSKDYFSEFE